MLKLHKLGFLFVLEPIRGLIRLSCLDYCVIINYATRRDAVDQTRGLQLTFVFLNWIAFFNGPTGLVLNLPF